MTIAALVAWALYILALVLVTVLDTDRLLYGPPRRRGGPSPATPPARGDDAPSTPPTAKERTVLVLKRKEGQWVDVTHRSGDVLRIRVCQVEAGQPGHLNLAFDDPARNFAIERPERAARRAAAEVSP